MERIKSSAEISLIFKEGKRIGTKNMTLIVMRNEEQHGPSGRAAFIAGKKLGNAVWRNRAKRRMRAICNENEQMFDNLSVLFVARQTINDVPYARLVEDAKRAMRKISAQ